MPVNTKRSHKFKQVCLSSKPALEESVISIANLSHHPFGDIILSYMCKYICDLSPIPEASSSQHMGLYQVMRSHQNSY